MWQYYSLCLMPITPWLTYFVTHMNVRRYNKMSSYTFTPGVDQRRYNRPTADKVGDMYLYGEQPQPCFRIT